MVDYRGAAEAAVPDGLAHPRPYWLFGHEDASYKRIEARKRVEGERGREEGGEREQRGSSNDSGFLVGINYLFPRPLNHDRPPSLSGWRPTSLLGRELECPLAVDAKR